MPRLKLILAYDGRVWRGWQSQPNRETVQDRLEEALHLLTGTRVVVHGSGRTDAGVHAKAQVAHIDVESRWPTEAWQRALNGNLPVSIRILSVEEALPDFHARFDAKGKIYRYRIWRGNVMNPFEVGLAWHLHGKLDMAVLKAGAEAYCGTHNFARLSANRGDVSEIQRREDAEGLTRTIKRVEIEQDGPILNLVFEGDGFLYKMVRLMTGSLIHAARGRANTKWLSDLVNQPSGEKSNHCAPADGLYLEHVIYQ